MESKYELYEYFGKRVKIISNKGNEWHGRVINYTSALDNDDENEESIICSIDGHEERRLKGTNYLHIEFMAHEIKSIEMEEK